MAVARRMKSIFVHRRINKDLVECISRDRTISYIELQNIITLITFSFCNLLIGTYDILIVS